MNDWPPENELDPRWDTWQSICQDAAKEEAELKIEEMNWKDEHPR